MQEHAHSDGREGFTGELWRSIENIYAQILAHPFLRGLTDGTLSEERFRFYILQDAFYLREYARDRDPSFIRKMMAYGQEQAEKFLKKSLPLVGARTG